MIPISYCYNDEAARSIGLSVSGELLLSDGGGNWALFDFNAQYSGYYPHCRFTAVSCCGGLFYAAAVAEDGAPWVFTSLMGGVWEPVNLIPHSLDGNSSEPTGEIIRILYDDRSNQVFLISNNGEIVTLPDCPRCVKVKRVSCDTIIDGWIDTENAQIEMVCPDGKELRLPLRDAVQYRADAGFVKQLMRNGGYFVDVRDPRLPGWSPIDGSICVPLEELPDWLPDLPGSTVLAFFCRHGSRSDRAAEYARSIGYQRAYSLGGINDFDSQSLSVKSQAP